MIKDRIGRVMAGIAAIPPIKDEAAFREQVAKDAKDLFSTFTDEENMEIAFAPLVISHVAWHYTDIVLNECVEKRIQITKPLTRAVRTMRSMYESSLQKDLDRKHIENIAKQCDEFMNECAYDFTILWWSVNQALKTLYPDDPFIELRTNTYCAILAIRVLRDHVKRMNEKVISRIPGSLAMPVNPHMKGLEALLDGYMSDFTIDETIHIQRCRAVFMKNINKIEWGVIPG